MQVVAALTHSTAANAISLVALSGTLIGGLLGIIFKYSERVDAINKQIEADRTAAAAAREADRTAREVDRTAAAAAREADRNAREADRTADHISREVDRTAAAAAREADRQLFLTLSKEIVANRQAANDMYLKFLDARDADLTSRQSIQDAIAVLKSRTG